MKKIILVGFCLLAFRSIGFAEKATSWTELGNIRARVEINKSIGDDYYPISFAFYGDAGSADNGKRSIRSWLTIGTSRTTPFNLDTLAGQKQFYQALPDFLKPVLLDLRDQATSEDLSN